MYSVQASTIGMAARGSLPKPVRDALLDRLTHGVVLLDDVGRFTFANRAARQSFARSRDLRLDGGSLRFADPVAQARFHRVFDAALAGEPAAMTLSTVGQPSMVLIVVPCDDPAGDASRVAVILGCRDAAHQASVDALASMFGLTRAEVRVLKAFLGDRSPDGIAMDAGVSVRTVRTQLSSIYGKLGVSGQRELLVLVSQMPPFAVTAGHGGP